MPKAINQLTISIFTLTILVTLASTSCNRGGSKPPSGDTAVAATVNGKNIMLSEVDTILNQQAKGQQAQMSPLELAAARVQVLESLIQQEVLFQRAEKEKLLPTEDEVTNFINQQKQDNRMTEEEYQRRLKESNQTEQALRETARKQIAVQKLQEKTFGRISISDKEVEDFYKNNQQQFVNPRGISLAMIVVDPTDNGAQDDAKNESAAKAKIEEISQQLKGGSDFATVARARSEDQSNVRGGDIGFITEEQLRENRFPPDLIGRFFGDMRVGDITPPVRFESGRFYIFKLQDKRLASENLTLDSPGVRERIKDNLLNQRRTLLNAALLEVAMNEAKVVNHLAQNMLNSPSNLSGLRPALAAGASPAASPASSPVATASPAATTQSTPR